MATTITILALFGTIIIMGWRMTAIEKRLKTHIESEIRLAESAMEAIKDMNDAVQKSKQPHFHVIKFPPQSMN